MISGDSPNCSYESYEIPTFSSSLCNVKKKTSRCALKLSSLAFRPLLPSTIIPFGAGGSVVGGNGSRSVEAMADGDWVDALFSGSWGLYGADGSDTCGRLGGRRPRERREASAADRPAAYELMIFFSA